MNFIETFRISVGSHRIRRLFTEEGIEELKESILTRGLFSPILLQKDGHTLVAGERRFRAIQRLYNEGRTFLFDGNVVPPGHIPFVRVGEEDSIQLLEAELEENTKRHQLTWQEETAAVAAIHRLRVKENPDHTFSETSDFVQLANVAAVKDRVLLDEYLDDPEIFAAPSRKEALKILERKLEKAYNASVARKFDSAPSKNWAIQHGSLLDILPTLSVAEFDCIIADPPYGINAHSFVNQKAVPHAYSDTPAESDQIYAQIAFHGFRLSKKEAHLYFFCDINRFQHIVNIIKPYGWKIWPWPLIWYKGANIGILPWPDKGPRRTYEAILFAVKGDKRVKAVAPDVITVQHDSTTERGAHKPVALYAELIHRSCGAGEYILDPCCGTGPVFPAAISAKCRAFGIEIDEAACGQAIRRLEDGDEAFDNPKVANSAD